MVAGFLATAILMPFAAAHLSVTWALAAWIVFRDRAILRASAPLVFPDALRARPTVIVATIGMLLVLPMMAPALAVRLVPGTELLRR